MKESKESEKKFIIKDNLLVVVFILLTLVIFLGQSLIKFYFLVEILYLLPISLSSWYIGKGRSLTLTLFSAALIILEKVFNLQNINIFSQISVIILNILFFLFVWYIIRLLKSKGEKEEVISKIDSMTGISNRMSFFEISNLEIKRSRRYKHPFTVAYIDIDDFKMVNETFGYEAGDNLLISIAKTVAQNIRSSDVSARLGNNEFAILFTETGNEAFVPIINKIRNLLFEFDIVKKNPWDITFSIGCVTFLKPPESVDDMVNRLNIIMDSTRTSGRNSICFETIGEE